MCDCVNAQRLSAKKQIVAIFYKYFNEATTRRHHKVQLRNPHYKLVKTRKHLSGKDTDDIFGFKSEVRKFHKEVA